MRASDKTHRLAPSLFLVFVVAAAATAYAPRVAHYRGWEADRAHHFAGAVVASGTDSYYWFRIARELRDGTWDAESLDPLRDHPDGRRRGAAPWISRVIAGIANGFDVDVYRAGLWFTLATSCLFVFPMSLFGWRVGWPAAGLLGALIAAASVAYFSRASIHRVDTDGANLFGLWWIAFVFALPRHEMSTRSLLGLSALAGSSVALFVGWYDQAGFWLVLVASFLVCLIARGFATRRVLALFAVFVACANPLDLLASIGAIADYITDYLNPSLGVGAVDSTALSPLEYSSISSRIEEMSPFPIERSLSRILEPAWLAAIGLLTFGVWAIRDWRRAAPLAPLAALGLLGLLSAKRFVMYLAPLVGFGLGVALTYIVRRAMDRTRFSPRAELVACLFAFAAFALLAPGTFYDNRPEASNSAKLLASLQGAKKQLPAGSVVWHSWGAGYLVQDVLGAATFNDGERPNPVIDHLLVKGLTSDDPRELQRVVAHLMSHSRSEVTEAFRADYAAAYAEMLAGDGAFSGDAFLLFNPRSSVEFPNYYYRGQWDFRTGTGRSEAFHKLRCGKPTARLYPCRDVNGQAIELDLSKGMVSQATPFEKALIIRDDAVAQEFDYPHHPGQVLQVFSRSGSGSVIAFLMSPDAHASNLNQLYMLDRADERYFEKVYDDLPVLRMYRVKGSVPDDPERVDAPTHPAFSAGAS
jgi:undecaprenyl-diphosphooligosaccharide--protein glycosyltransferase